MAARVEPMQLAFQHTAARRRLASMPLFAAASPSVSTHSRPKAAGVFRFCSQVNEIGFNTQPPEGGWRRPRFAWQKIGFNTQPPEGGWSGSFDKVLPLAVSTHSRPKAAGKKIEELTGIRRVSTHSRPKAAGSPARMAVSIANSFNTQPPEGGWQTKALRLLK